MEDFNIYISSRHIHKCFIFISRCIYMGSTVAKQYCLVKCIATMSLVGNSMSVNRADGANMHSTNNCSDALFDSPKVVEQWPHFFENVKWKNIFNWRQWKVAVADIKSSVSQHTYSLHFFFSIILVDDRKSCIYHSSNTQQFYFIFSSCVFIILSKHSKTDCMQFVECVTLFVLRVVYWRDMNQHRATDRHANSSNQWSMHSQR